MGQGLVGLLWYVMVWVVWFCLVWYVIVQLLWLVWYVMVGLNWFGSAPLLWYGWFGLDRFQMAETCKNSTLTVFRTFTWIWRRCSGRRVAGVEVSQRTRRRRTTPAAARPEHQLEAGLEAGQKRCRLSVRPLPASAPCSGTTQVNK